MICIHLSEASIEVCGPTFGAESIGYWAYLVHDKLGVLLLKVLKSDESAIFQHSFSLAVSAAAHINNGWSRRIYTYYEQE